MCLTASSHFTSALYSIQTKCTDDAHYLRQCLASAGNGIVTSAKNSHTKSVNFFNTDEGIVRFIKKNWSHLLMYAIAWSIIVSGVGLMYGFKVTAMPLSIGLGCGVAFGALLGVATVVAFDRNNYNNRKPRAINDSPAPHKDVLPNTLWGFLNKGFNSLDANGTRAIAVSVCVTVVLAATVVFPYALGAILGIVIGNHIATKIGYNIKKSCGYEVYGHLDMGPNTKDPLVIADKLKQAELLLAQLQKDFKEANIPRSQPEEH